MLFSSLSYSIFLVICIDKKEHYGIHPWYYVKSLDMKYPNLIKWGKLFKHLHGNRSQVLRMVKYIGQYLITRKPKNNYRLTHPKLDYKTLKELENNQSYPFSIYQGYKEIYNMIKSGDHHQIMQYLLLAIQDEKYSIDMARCVIYSHRFSIPIFQITSDNVADLLKILESYPKLAQLPWLADIYKYTPLCYKPMYENELLTNIYANPNINKNAFIQFTEIYPYYKIHPFLFIKHIRNMFQFRMRKRLGIELYYPQCDNGLQE